jgi:energy-coupling factor transporter ATP-binding protein EcfA2
MLLGENGVGKSSVLKAIALAMMPTSQLRRFGGDIADWVTRGSRSQSGMIRLEFTVGAQPLELHFSGKTGRVVRKGDFPNMAVLGYGATRLLPRPKDRAPRPERVRVQNLFDARAPLRDAEPWIADMRRVSTLPGTEMRGEFLFGIEQRGLAERAATAKQALQRVQQIRRREQFLVERQLVLLAEGLAADHVQPQRLGGRHGPTREFRGFADGFAIDLDHRCSLQTRGVERHSASGRGAPVDRSRPLASIFLPRSASPRNTSTARSRCCCFS